jgi:hypothetical protein
VPLSGETIRGHAAGVVSKHKIIHPQTSCEHLKIMALTPRPSQQPRHTEGCLSARSWLVIDPASFDVPQSGLGRGGSRLKQKAFCPRRESADKSADAEEMIAGDSTHEMLGSISAICSALREHLR